MKKLLFLVIFIMLLSGCHIKDAPDEMEVPSGSSIAVCNDGEHKYTFVYQNDGIYLYFINDVEQDENMVDTIQEQAYLHEESVENYIFSEFTVDQCSIGAYDGK